MLSAELISTLAKRGRIDIIRTLKAFPDRDFTINELAKVSNVPTMTAWRAVKDLKRAGIVMTRRFGNAISVSMTEDREKLRALKLVPDTDPQRSAARLFATRLSQLAWTSEFRLFGSIGRGEHSPGEEVDVAIVYDDGQVSEGDAKLEANRAANEVRSETNVTIMPLCIAQKEMSRKGGLAAELRDKEVIWKR
ncbi:MAG TPA: ArsR family transcriptional regulator [Thermoplasmata archaeon]|nr:ArsR family transcriptional regulator [Thermoplasmata archaeon]